MSDPLTHVRRKLAIVTKDKDVCGGKLYGKIREWPNDEIQVLVENETRKTTNELKILIPQRTIHAICNKCSL